MVPRLLNLLTEPTVTHPDLKVAVAYALGKTAITKVTQLIYRRNNPDKVEKLLFLGPMKEIAKSMLSRILFFFVWRFDLMFIIVTQLSYKGNG